MRTKKINSFWDSSGILRSFWPEEFSENKISFQHLEQERFINFQMLQ